MKKTIMLLAVLGGLAFAAAANANSLTLVNDTPNTTGAFDWNYHVDWANSLLQAGDFIRLQNAGGVTSVNTVVFGPGSFVGSFVGTTVTWTYTGPDQNLGSGTGSILGFSFHSTVGLAAADPYNTQDHVASGNGAGQISTVTGFVSGPTTPDGGSAAALLGIALAGIEAARRLIRPHKA